MSSKTLPADPFSPINLELRFDQKNISDLGSCSNDDAQALMTEILIHADCGDHFKVLEKCDKLFSLLIRSQETAGANTDQNIILRQKIFTIQWAIAASEMLFDLPRRKLWSNRWSQVSAWHADYWARFIFNFQEALTYFFSGSLRESELYFQNCLSLALEQNYTRGIYRSFFHLALIERDRQNYSRAYEYLKRALIIARQSKSIRYVEKIQSELEELKTLNGLSETESKIFLDLKHSLFQSARRRIFYLFRLRKRDGISLERNSERLLLGLLLHRLDKKQSFAIVVNRINDSVVKHRLFLLCEQLGKLASHYRYQLQQIRMQLGICSNSTKNQESSLQLSQDSRRLLSLLEFHTSGLSKEEISFLIWSQEYDPLYHDPKIYKLILKCRRECENDEVIKNTYGLYKIGQSYIPSLNLHEA